MRLTELLKIRPSTASQSADLSPAALQDVAIAYGYNQLQEATPQTVTAGRELPLNQLVELLRGECAAAGHFCQLLASVPSAAGCFHMSL